MKQERYSTSPHRMHMTIDEAMRHAHASSFGQTNETTRRSLDDMRSGQKSGRKNVYHLKSDNFSDYLSILF